MGLIGIESYFVAISVFLQFLVAGMAIHRAIKSLEKHRITWSMLALVFTLMAFRRTVSFLLSIGISIPFSFPEVIALTISILLCFSMYNISKILPALENIIKKVPDTSKELRSIASELTREIEFDKEGIIEYKSNGEALKKSREALGDASEKLVVIARNLERFTSGMESSGPNRKTE